jgi:hypothetical protein
MTPFAPLGMVLFGLVFLTDMYSQNYFFIKLLLAEWTLELFFPMTPQQMLYGFEQLPENPGFYSLISLRRLRPRRINTQNLWVI